MQAGWEQLGWSQDSEFAAISIAIPVLVLPVPITLCPAYFYAL